MKFKLILYSVLCLVPIENALAFQNESNQQKTFQFRDVPGIIIRDFGHVAKTPLREPKKSALLTAMVVGSVFLIDDQLDEEYAVEKDPIPYGFFHEISEVGAHYEKTETYIASAGIIGGFAAGGLILKNHKMVKTAGLITESLIISTAITAVLKRSFGRARPYTDEGSRDFSLFKAGSGEDRLSLPSGHTASAFTIMTVIAKQYPHWWVQYPAYGFAASVALRRIEGRNHWASDVLLGGAIGYTVSNAITQRHRSEQDENKLQAFWGGNRLGLIYQF